MELAIYICFACVFLIFVFLLITVREKNRSIERLTSEKQQTEEHIRQIIAERSQAQAQLEALKGKAQSDRDELDRLQGSFRNEFKNLANEILEQKSKQFNETNHVALTQLLKPFKDNISDFKERVEKIYADENSQRGALKSEIKNLLELNRKITEETNNLTNALKGNSKVQGDWGEMILETILDNSNLINGIHYTTQENIKDDQGNNLRPDVILNLPDNKQVIIDSKVSLTAFVGYANAEDAEKSGRYMKDHLRSVRSHVDELGSKRYQTLVNSPDFVIMFIPNEPAFMAALQGDNSIWGEAYNKKVIISSPTNLFALLKIVDDLWKRDNQSKNAIAIANEGANLYDKLMGFLDTLLEIGKNIDATSRSYEKAINQIKTGKGNLVGRSQKMAGMGLKATKNLPAQMSDFDEEA